MQIFTPFKDQLEKHTTESLSRRRPDLASEKCVADRSNTDMKIWKEKSDVVLFNLRLTPLS